MLGLFLYPMLTQDDKNRIIELRSKNYSYDAIHKKLGFSITIVMRVCKEEEKQINNIKTGEIQKNREQVQINSTIIETQEIEKRIVNLIKKGKRKTEEKKQLQERLEQLRKLLREEVEEKREEWIKNAVDDRDQLWNKIIN